MARPAKSFFAGLARLNVMVIPSHECVPRQGPAPRLILHLQYFELSPASALQCLNIAAAYSQKSGIKGQAS
jgi:hypothetical protein